MEEFGKIYIIVSPSTKNIYIGKTVQTLDERLKAHKRSYKGWISRGFRRDYCSSFEILKYNDCKIELIETLYEDKLMSREKYHINHYDNCINLMHNNNLSNPTFLCSCGCIVISTNRHKHSKSQRHRRYIKEMHALVNNKPISFPSTMNLKKPEPIIFDLFYERTIDIF